MIQHDLLVFKVNELATLIPPAALTPFAMTQTIARFQELGCGHPWWGALFCLAQGLFRMLC